MNQTELAYFRLCVDVWQAGAALWIGRWMELVSAMPVPETSNARALRARASFRLIG